MSWSAGDEIALRWTGHRSWLDEKHELEAGRRRIIPGLLQGWPHYVVEDRPDLLVLWMPAGSVTQLVDLADRGRAAVPSVWRRDRLLLMFPGKPYAVALDWTPDPDREFSEKPQRLYVEQRVPARFFEQQSRPFEGTPAHTFLGWTVNLQAPFARTAAGVDSTDGALDVVVKPDLTWSWKNEDVMPLLVDLGIYRNADVTDFQDAGREVIAMLESRRFPFDGSYLDWLPPETWDIPTLPRGWELVPGYNLNRTTGALVPLEPLPSV
jgi:hypothetical protein